MKSFSCLNLLTNARQFLKIFFNSRDLPQSVLNQHCRYRYQTKSQRSCLDTSIGLVSLNYVSQRKCADASPII